MDVVLRSNVGDSIFIGGICYQLDGPTLLPSTHDPSEVTAYADCDACLAARPSSSSSSAAPVGPPFITTWLTTTPYEIIGLPLIPEGIYAFTVDWGDGTSDYITSYSDPARNHLYATAGSHTVTITGTLVGWSFGGTNGTYKDSLTDVTAWGCLRNTNTAHIGFFRCLSLTYISATDLPDFSGATYLMSIFDGCTNLTGVNRLDEWDVSHIVELDFSFRDCPNFNQSMASWDISNVYDLGWMFANDAAFNQPIGSWNTGSIQTMYNILLNASSFNQDLSGWDVTGLHGPSEKAELNLVGTAMSTANYSASLIGWGAQAVQNRVILRADATYSAGAASARAALITAGWEIYDGGPV